MAVLVSTKILIGAAHDCTKAVLLPRSQSYHTAISGNHSPSSGRRPPRPVGSVRGVTLRLPPRKPQNALNLNPSGWWNPISYRAILTQDRRHQPNGTRIAFWAESRAEVDRLARLVRKIGGKNLEGPGLCPSYSAGYYACFFEDPDGNKLEICCRENPIVAGWTKQRQQGATDHEISVIEEGL
jgi:catechol 2,3-dioxygenase-like lactoylglutathione lyase family enzyme